MGDINTPYISDPNEMKILESDMRGKLKYTLMNDFLAKYTLQNDLFALKGLLAALLNVALDDVTKVEILNLIMLNEAINDKQCILDVKLELNQKQIINIEIQTVYQNFWPERSLTYLCKNFDQLKPGEHYDKIKPCIQIGILQSELFPDKKCKINGRKIVQRDPRYTGKFYSTYRMLEVTEYTEYSSKFELRVLSLKHIENVSEEEKRNHNGLYYWAKLFTAETWEELKMVAEENDRMQSFVGTVKKLSAEEKVAMACEARRRHSIEVATYEWQIQQAKKELEEEQQKVREEQQKSESLSSELEEVKRINEELIKKLAELQKA